MRVFLFLLCFASWAWGLCAGRTVVLYLLNPVMFTTDRYWAVVPELFLLCLVLRLHAALRDFLCFVLFVVLLLCWCILSGFVITLFVKRGCLLCFSLLCCICSVCHDLFAILLVLLVGYVTYPSPNLFPRYWSWYRHYLLFHRRKFPPVNITPVSKI